MEDKVPNNDQFIESVIKAGGKIPGFDIHKGLEEVGDDFENWLEIISIFVDTTPGLLEALKDQCDKNDPQYPVTAHGIKGVCYTVGAVAAGDKARELELCAKKGDTAFVRENTGILVSITEKLIDDLSKLLRKNPDDG